MANEEIYHYCTFFGSTGLEEWPYFEPWYIINICTQIKFSPTGQIWSLFFNVLQIIRFFIKDVAFGFDQRFWWASNLNADGTIFLQLTQGGMIQQAVATCSSNHFSQPNPALNLRPPMISPLQIAASVSASLTASMAPSTHLHPTPLMGNNNPTCEYYELVCYYGLCVCINTYCFSWLKYRHVSWHVWIDVTLADIALVKIALKDTAWPFV